MSTIAWVKCRQYREEYGCLCKEARDRLRLKGGGREVFEGKLREIRKPVPERPAGWTVSKMSRFYVISDEEGELVHRATNQAECEAYMRLAATAEHLATENKALWQLLEDELTTQDDPWEQLDRRIAESGFTDSEPSEPESDSESQSDW